MSPPRNDELPDLPTTMELLTPIMRTGLAWLFDTVQPDTAIATHHGVTLAGPPETNRTINFGPIGWQGWPVLVLEVQHVLYPPPGGENPVHNPLRDGEMDAFAALLVVLDVPWQHQWNGDGYISGSTSIARQPGPSLAAALQRYRARCPVHDSVFCGHADRHGGSNCSWLRDGTAALIVPDRPTYPAVSSATAQEGSSA
jgi:hypothetical protein